MKPLIHKLSSEQKQAITARSSKYKDADVSCIQCIAQAAINVELFTIPLYMTSMYSIVGTHQINGKNDFYVGRWWPGKGPTRKPETANDKAFNLIFSVFIEEMLHLQLASNMASLINVKPNFTSPLLMTDRYGWICYGTPQTPSYTIPHIIDLQDTNNYSDVQVQLATMNKEQVKLFMAIEESEEQVDLKPDVPEGKYFKEAPFDDWRVGNTESDLPLFGTIGWMYTCLWDYLEIVYDDGTTMIDILTSAGEKYQQRDEFNGDEGGHMAEYPGVDATMNPEGDLREQLMNAINAITEQGEGGSVAKLIQQRWGLNAQGMDERVANKFQPSKEALINNYPYTNDEGVTHKGQPSGNAVARIDSAAQDHYEVFAELQDIILNDKDYQTWDQWHAIPGNKWTADMLNPTGAASKYKIPSADEVADALNKLKEQDVASGNDENYNLFSLAAVGTIMGITTQLNDYWAEPKTQFPSPAMGGSGDRVSICWAITGKVPELWKDIPAKEHGKLYHACQGMVLNTPESCNTSQMPSVEVYHSCKGSNTCATEGGCGFVQNKEGGSNCGGSSCNTKSDVKDGSGCGLPIMSAPANNKCAGSGGCAVPISASQLYPKPSSSGSYVMQVYKYDKEGNPTELCEMSYEEGEPVYDVAWRAYEKSMSLNCDDTPPIEQPKPDLLRLAFPPST